MSSEKARGNIMKHLQRRDRDGSLNGMSGEKARGKNNGTPGTKKQRIW
jgi:hypothetical protein